MMDKFNLFNESMIHEKHVMVWFRASGFWNTLGEGERFKRPNALLVTWPIKPGMDHQILALHPDPVNRSIKAGSNILTPMRRVMGNWTPWVGEHIEILRGQPDLKTGMYSAVSWHIVDFITPSDSELNEIYVCLDGSEK